MTVVTAMGQMFYSLSVAMGILVTFGSYEKGRLHRGRDPERRGVRHDHRRHGGPDDHSGEVFAFSDGNPDALQAGPALMFITLPKVFASMDLGGAVGVLFFRNGAVAADAPGSSR